MPRLGLLKAGPKPNPRLGAMESWDYTSRSNSLLDSSSDFACRQPQIQESLPEAELRINTPFLGAGGSPLSLDQFQVADYTRVVTAAGLSELVLGQLGPLLNNLRLLSGGAHRFKRLANFQFNAIAQVSRTNFLLPQA